MGLYSQFSGRKAGGEKPLVEKQRACWKDEWTFKRTEKRQDSCDNVYLGVGPTSVSKKKLEKSLPGRRFVTVKFFPEALLVGR